MGVYHFMGLGRSVGVVTTALSYLAARFQRNNTNDQNFFATSGEVNQTAPRGDTQALVLFTSPEVRVGLPEGLCTDYTDNKLGQESGKSAKDEKMAEALQRLSAHELHLLAGGRRELDVYWCDCTRNDAPETFERVARVMAAAKPRGELGKEVWINLTGGWNALNLALQLAPALSGVSARLYYLLVDYKFTRLTRPALPLAQIGTAADHFWLEMPLIYLAFDQAHRTALAELEQLAAPIREAELLSRLKAQSPEFHNLDEQAFRRLYLVPLYAQQLLQWQQGHVQAGARWPLFKRYYEVMSRVLTEEATTLTRLATSEAWFHHSTFTLRG
jgi:hypothetical protein